MAVFLMENAQKAPFFLKKEKEDFIGTDKYGCVRKHTESAAPQRGCEVAKLALCGEDVKTAAVPPCEVPLTGCGCVNGCVLGQTSKFAQSQNTACLGRYLATDDDGQERTVTDARGSVSALAELRQNKTTPLFLKSGEGFGEGENFGADVRLFLVKKSFSLLPGSHLPLS